VSRFKTKASKSINGNLNNQQSSSSIANVSAPKPQPSIPTKKLVQLFKNRSLCSPVKDVSTLSLAKQPTGMKRSLIKPSKSKIDSHRLVRPTKPAVSTKPKKLTHSEASNLNRIPEAEEPKNFRMKSINSTSFDPSSTSIQPARPRRAGHLRNKSMSAEIRKSRSPFLNPQRSIAFSVRTKKGVNGNSKKMNQDSFTAALHFRDNTQEHLFAVFDGHGSNGHLVSNYLSTNIASVLQAKLQQNPAPEIALHNSYKALFDALLKGPIDIAFSGSTAVCCLVQDGVIYCANCGDSRAILGLEGDSGEFTFKKLSVDHKLDLPEERSRIEQQGGKVEEFVLSNGERCGPLRVWLPGKSVPGLAMSRSIGDLVAASVGVLWNPGTVQ
jgi:serine/threonine protein phosphatase PrpC